MNAYQSKSSLTVLLAACGLLSAVAGTTRADFTLVEDFDDLAPGGINGQNGWVAASASSQVIADPADPENQILEVTTDSTTAYAPLLIPDGTVRMLFFRFCCVQQLNFSFGMSDAAAPDEFHDFESEIGLSNAIGELRIRDGSDYDVLCTLAPDTWYSVWMLINNADDTTQVYLHARPGDRATGADLQGAAGQTVFEFRNGTAGNLLAYFIKTGGGNSANSGPLHIDDIYVENTAVPNLWNPTALSGGASCDPPSTARCPDTDVNCDDITNGLDVAEISSSANFGLAAYAATEPRTDVNRDGMVNGLDVAAASSSACFGQ